VSTPRFAVSELRLVVTTDELDEALYFYRDVLGLPERAAFVSEGGRVVILEAGGLQLTLFQELNES
jgi:lactoylglutathione lyase